MECTRAIARFVGRWAIPNLQDRVREASPSLQSILTRVDLTKGYMFVYAPPGTPIERLSELKRGGMIQGRWLSSNMRELSKVPQKMLTNYLWSWLQSKEKHSCSHSPSLSRILLAENPLWLPGDPLPQEPPRFLLYADTLYVWVCDQDNTLGVQSLIEEVDLAYPPLLLCGIVGRESLRTNDGIGSMLKSEGEMKYSVELIVIGVFDGESFLVWRRHKILTEVTELV